MDSEGFISDEVYLFHPVKSCSKMRRSELREQEAEAPQRRAVFQGIHESPDSTLSL